MPETSDTKIPGTRPGASRLSLTVRGAAGEDRPVAELELDPMFRERYEIERELGRGGSGMVLLARDLSMDRQVAIKVLMRLDDEDRERFKAEAQLLARLSHANLVQVYDIGFLGYHPYMVIAYQEGGTLRERLAAGPLKADEAVRVALDVLAALETCHRTGVVHRDVKPENVLFGADGTARLADLGIARWFGARDHLTQTGALIGTPAYMSPEQIRGEEASTASDVHAVGLLLIEMLTGVRPFTELSLTALLDAKLNRSPDVRALVPGLPEPLAAAIAAAAAVKRADRPQTAAALTRRLERALAPATSGRTAAPPSGPRPRTVACALAAAVCVLIGFPIWRFYFACKEPYYPEPEIRTVVTVPVASDPPPPSAPPPAPAPRPRKDPHPPVATLPKNASKLFDLTRSYIEKLTRMTPDERQKLRISLERIADRRRKLTAADLKAMASTRTHAFKADEFYFRLEALRDHFNTDEVRQGLYHLERVWWMNSMRAAQRLDRAIEDVLAGRPLTVASVRAALSDPEVPALAPPPEGLTPRERAKRQFQEGEDLYQKARIGMASGDTSYLANLTRCARLMADAARGDYNKPRALFYLGSALLLRDRSPEDTEKACDILARSLQLDEDKWTRRHLGFAHALAGRLDKGIEHMEAALTLDEKWAETHFHLCGFYDKASGPKDQGRKVFEHAKAAIRERSEYKKRCQELLRFSVQANRVAKFVIDILDRTEHHPLSDAEIDAIAKQAEENLSLLGGVAVAVSDYGNAVFGSLAAAGTGALVAVAAVAAPLAYAAVGFWSMIAPAPVKAPTRTHTPSAPTATAPARPSAKGP
jgi:serine/threonine protein kinase